jgi:hypothetical protein
VGEDSGIVRIYLLDANGTWEQIGDDIMNGCAAGDNFGSSVSLSGDGNVVAVGSPLNSDNRLFSGQVRLFRITENLLWFQMGQSIYGETDYYYFGSSVDISDGGNTIVVG